MTSRFQERGAPPMSCPLAVEVTRQWLPHTPWISVTLYVRASSSSLRSAMLPCPLRSGAGPPRGEPVLRDASQGCSTHFSECHSSIKSR